MSPQDFRYSNDKNLFDLYLQNPKVIQIKEKIKNLVSGYGMSHTRNLYAHSVQLQPEIYPDIFKSLNETCKALGFKETIKVFINQSPFLNGYCFRDASGSPIMGLHSALVEKFTGDELKFVMGHELGHLMFEHSELPMPIIAQFRDPKGETLLKIESIIELFVWSRAAEISADRAGYAAIGNLEASVNALFKLSSGLSRQITLEQAKKYLTQIDAFQFTPSSSQAALDPQNKSLDCFQSHPFSPLRIQSLFLFDEFYNGKIKKEDCDHAVSEYLGVMKPKYLSLDDPGSKLLKYFLGYAGYALMHIDSKNENVEQEFLASLIGKDSIDDISFEKEDFVQKRVEVLIADIIEKCSSHQIMNMLLHLCLLVNVDGEHTQEETQLLQSYFVRLGSSEQACVSFLASIRNSLD